MCHIYIGAYLLNLGLTYFEHFLFQFYCDIKLTQYCLVCSILVQSSSECNKCLRGKIHSNANQRRVSGGEGWNPPLTHPSAASLLLAIGSPVVIYHTGALCMRHGC